MLGLLYASIVYAQTHPPKQITINTEYVNPNPQDSGRAIQPKMDVTRVGVHPITATTTISEEALRQYLESKKSPLAPYHKEILQSKYWSSIIAICTIEEYSCSVNPYGTNNLWGLMAGGRLLRFDSLPAGIAAIDSFLAKAESNGRTTIESFRGWYCASACTTWEPTVIKTKLKLESL